MLLTRKENKYMKYELEEFVRHIGEYAFNGNNTIRSVTMPDSVQTVGRYAFREVKKLSSIRLSKSLRKLEEGVFLGSNKLREFDFDGKIVVKKNL